MREIINRHWAAKSRMILAAGAVMALCTGCQTTADPSKGGLLSGLAGLYGGKYEERQANLQKALEAAQQEQTTTQAEAKRLVQELADKDKDVQVLRQRLAKLDGQVADLQKRANALQAGNKKLSEKQKAAIAQLADLQKKTIEAKAQVNESIYPEIHKTQAAQLALSESALVAIAGGLKAK